MNPANGRGEIRSALEDKLSGHFQKRLKIRTLKRRPCPRRSSYSLDEIDVRLEDGGVLSLIFKDLSPAAMLEAARRVKPAFVHDPSREIWSYENLLASRSLGTPEFYGALVDERARRYWLFIERVIGQELYKIGDLNVWKKVACWLARFHDSTFRCTQFESNRLVNYDGRYYKRWLKRMKDFAPESGSKRRQIEWLVSQYPRIIERLLALPATIIHGEFYASNVLIQSRGGSFRVCPVDWEMTGHGPALMDLAALAAGKWTETEKFSLALAYQGSRSSLGISEEDFPAALDCCRVHLAVQWLGWSANWSPPADQAQDWLGEAMGLLEKSF